SLLDLRAIVQLSLVERPRRALKIDRRLAFDRRRLIDHLLLRQFLFLKSQLERAEIVALFGEVERGIEGGLLIDGLRFLNGERHLRQPLDERQLVERSNDVALLDYCSLRNERRDFELVQIRLLQASGYRDCDELRRIELAGGRDHDLKL